MNKANFVTMTAKCDFCGKEVQLKLKTKDVEEYFSPNRRNIQDIFPYLSADDRAFNLSYLWRLLE